MYCAWQSPNSGEFIINIGPLSQILSPFGLSAWFSLDFHLFFDDHVSPIVFLTTTEEATRALALSRRKHGVVHASVTKLATKLDVLEGQVSDSYVTDHAQRLASKLESLDAKFKVHDYSVIELIKSEKDLEREQDILDQHDDTVSELGVCVKKLISVCSSSSTSPSSPANFQYVRQVAPPPLTSPDLRVRLHEQHLGVQLPDLSGGPIQLVTCVLSAQSACV